MFPPRTNIPGAGNASYAYSSSIPTTVNSTPYFPAPVSSSLSAFTMAPSGVAANIAADQARLTRATANYNAAWNGWAQGNTFAPTADVLAAQRELTAAEQALAADRAALSPAPQYALTQGMASIVPAAMTGMIPWMGMQQVNAGLDAFSSDMSYPSSAAPVAMPYVPAPYVYNSGNSSGPVFSPPPSNPYASPGISAAAPYSSASAPQDPSPFLPAPISRSTNPNSGNNDISFSDWWRQQAPSTYYNDAPIGTSGQQGSGRDNSSGFSNNNTSSMPYPSGSTGAGSSGTTTAQPAVTAKPPISSTNNPAPTAAPKLTQPSSTSAPVAPVQPQQPSTSTQNRVSPASFEAPMNQNLLQSSVKIRLKGDREKWGLINYVMTTTARGTIANVGFFDNNGKRVERDQDIPVSTLLANYLFIGVQRQGFTLTAANRQKLDAALSEIGWQD